jgi:hypothetical protein
VEQLEDRCVLSAAGGPPLVFLGDSITAWYANAPSWAASIAPLGAADLGVPGLTVKGVQAELDAGMLDGMSPRVLVLMIGTNDLYLGVSPKDTAAGVAALVTNLRLDQPQAQVLLLAFSGLSYVMADVERLLAGHRTVGGTKEDILLLGSSKG